ncbi:MAG: type III secretion system export apparatus subunit SctR [Sulfitobacter sp.]
MDELTSPLIIGFVGSFFLLAILSLTAFIKVSVTLMIVRNALGLQQVPANTVVMVLSLFISIFVSMPVFTEATATISEANIEGATPNELFALARTAIEPFQEFLLRHTSPEHLSFFVTVSNRVWEGSGLVGTGDDFIIQVPSFMITQLTEAFEIGFLLYLPFVAIDLAVTGILMALGMQMVQPNIISVPFKLLTFVFVDGWSKLVEGLVLTYAA